MQAKKDVKNEPATLLGDAIISKNCLWQLESLQGDDNHYLKDITYNLMKVTQFIAYNLDEYDEPDKEKAIAAIGAISIAVESFERMKKP